MYLYLYYNESVHLFIHNFIYLFAYLEKGQVFEYNLVGNFNLIIHVLVIRRKDHGLTDIVSNEGRRPEFDTISVRP